MKAELFEIPVPAKGRLAVMPRPRSGDWLEDEIASWRRDKLDFVVSLLEDDEIVELDLKEEPAICERLGLTFVRFAIPDRGVPISPEKFDGLCTSLAIRLCEGLGVGLHCRMGVGRSALVAACILPQFGFDLDSAWATIEKARGLPVPDTAEQRQWVKQFVTRFARPPALNLRDG
jgi:protein-tyrosine phosphatase